MLTRRGWLKMVACSMVVLFGLAGGAAFAQSYDPQQDVPHPTLLQKRLNKLGRGISNVIFGWTEIPLTWDTKMKQGKPLTYLLTTAPVLGATKAVMRTGIGIYEVATFPTSRKDERYESLLEPEYLF